MKATIKKIELLNEKYAYLDDNSIEGDEYSILYDKYISEIEAAIQAYTISPCDCKEDETTGTITEDVCNNCGRAQQQ